jgi:putative CocE/NonD family hydrolase
MTVRILALLFLCFPAAAQPPQADAAAKQLEYTRAHYTKYDYRIPMRDGVKLFTSVYIPKDAAPSQLYPIVMQRTPYSVAPYGIDNYRATLGPSELFTKEGFIFAYQDVRGRYLSEGKFIDVPVHKPDTVDESTDTYDTVDWLVKNVPNNNGKVGMWGISYPGFYSAFALIHSHPALKAVSPQAPMGDVGNGDDAYHNGAFFLAANFGFYTGFKARGDEPERPQRGAPFNFGTQDFYEFYLRMGTLANGNEKYFKNENPYYADLLKHTSYDEFWQPRGLAQHMKDVTPAVMFVGGWFDAEDLAGPLKLFRALEKNGASAPDTLVMGPWPHGGWSRGDGAKLGNLQFASKTGEYFREKIELPFFLKHLKGKTEKGDLPQPKAWVFETGTGEWRRFDAWPPKNASAQTLYLNPSGKLSFTAASSSPAFEEYISDPARPVPLLGEIGEGMPSDYMTYDQRFASRRTDVLTYQTDPLEQDVTIAGPVTPSLQVSTSGTDSDFVVKLIDVYPDDYPSAAPIHMGGYQQLVRGEPFRGKFRNSMSKPEPFTPNKETKLEFLMPDVCHTFRPGHRIMVQIQSSWFPLTDRNPQVFTDIPNAKASDFQKATERIYRGSGVRVMVVK